MPSKRKAAGSAKASSAKRARTAAASGSPQNPNDVADSIVASGSPFFGDAPAESATPTSTLRRGRSRKDASDTPGSATGTSGKKALSAPRTRRSVRGQQREDAAGDDDGSAEDEGEDGDAVKPLAEIPTVRNDAHDKPSSGDELSRDQLPASKPAAVKPKPRSKHSKVTYKSRRSAVKLQNDTNGSSDEISHTTRSSPAIASRKVVPAPVTPATTLKPRSRPPKTQKKRVVPAPSDLNVAPVAPMGLGSEEVTPSAGHDRRASSGRRQALQLEEEDAEEDEGKSGETDGNLGGSDGKIVTPGLSARALREKGREELKKRLSLVTPAKETMATLAGLEDPFAIDEQKRKRVKGDSAADVSVETSDAPPVASDATGLEHFPGPSIRHLKKRVLGKLMGRERINLVGISGEEKNVRHLLEQTVAAGEGNSLLIIGARGTGKTTLLESAIADLTDEHKGEFLVVRLNGFFQTDDKIALREIWRQLGAEMELDEKEQPKATNFADTLSSILAILSHPDELRPPEETEADAENAPATTALSVVFILEEFHLFATHPRQTLLYNLFDIAQSRKAPIAVVGTTTRIDVVESLEKRVKSRFSHRTVHLKNPATLKGFWEICKEGLGIDMDEVYGEIAEVGEEDIRCFEAWNEHIERLYQTDKSFQRHLRRIYSQSKNPKSFFNSCILPLTTMHKTFPPGSAFPPSSSSSHNSLAPPDSILSVLAGLTDLQLTLLISAARLDVVSDTDTCNLNMAYDEYRSLTSSLKIQSSAAGVTAGRLWSKEVAIGAWEGLARYGLLIPVGGVGVGGGKEGKMWRVEVGLGEIGKCIEAGRAGAGRAGLGRWCREV